VIDRVGYIVFILFREIDIHLVLMSRHGTVIMNNIWQIEV